MVITTQTTQPDATDRPIAQEQVRRHLPLVVRLARRYHHRSGAELDDLIQVGSMGLLRAIRRFDASLGHLFEAYACAIISGEIRHYLRDQVLLVRPPRELVELIPAIKGATSQLKQQEHRDPSCAEIARATGLTANKVAEVLAMESCSKILSLDAEFDSEDEGQPMRWQIADEKYRSFQLATDDRIMLFQALAQLKASSRDVIEGFFFQDLSQQEIGRRLGISQTQVSRRLRSALRELWVLLSPVGTSEATNLLTAEALFMDEERMITRRCQSRTQ